MKYSRGRIIALTILSVTMVLALFGSGLLLNYRNFNSNAVNNEAFMLDPNYVPTFDDLYERIPFDKVDTGTVTMGQSTTLTLLEERYTRGSLTSFLNLNLTSTNRQSYPDFRRSQIYSKDGYSYPVFSSAEMQQIASGLGNNVEIPVIMLDPANYDDIVLLELTNLTDTPGSVSIERDGKSINNIIYAGAKYATYTADQVYAGIPNDTSVGGKIVEDEIYDADGNVLLKVICTPEGNTYKAEIKDADGNYLFMSNGTPVETIGVGTTELYDGSGTPVYHVERADNTITVYSADNVLLGTAQYTNSVFTDYKIGAVAYNGNALRGMFREEGFYQITFKQKVTNGDGTFAQIDVAISFVIVNKLNYANFPRFDLGNRVQGNGEIYNYFYESSYPTIKYLSSRFSVEVEQPAEKYYENDAELNAQRVLRFYRIGEYHLVSKLQYYSSYLANRASEFKKRGVEKGYVALKRYTEYSSVLNILGFQAYYGGGYDTMSYPNSKNGQLPFYDSEDVNNSSDISAWVRDASMTAADSSLIADYSNMRVSDALTYSTRLANYISNSGLKPVRTNFPPVKLYGNVGHATGAGTSGEAAAVLSSVAFLPAHGTGATAQWESSTLEVGAPFEEAGQYVVTVYFKVNSEICQQTFFFEIVNAAKIAFAVTTDNDPKPKTYYVGDLVLNQKLSGQTIAMSYDGETTLGQFEVLPTVILKRMDFDGKETKVQINTGENGAFSFVLEPGQYILTLKYGAHGQSTSEFNIVVDNTKAQNIKANTNAKALTGLPDNVAIVGAGAVNLTWDHKASGIGFNNVLYEFYEMKLGNAGMDANDPNIDRNYGEFGVAVNNLYAAYSFSSSPSKPDSGYQPIKTEDGWKLDETFEAAGLYRFTLIDDVGNETYFVLIIDDSAPTFIQSVESDIPVTNAVLFSESEGVRLGFGTNKLVTCRMGSDMAMISGAHGSIFENLANAGILVNDRLGIGNHQTITQTAISIGLSKIEYSKAGEIYCDVKEVFPDEDVKNGFVVLKEEGTYYFRVTDVLGNVGEYYIILTHDNSFGMVYAESNPLEIEDTNAHPKDRGIVSAKNPTGNTSLVTNTGGMTNRPYVTFSFVQRAGESTLFRVDRVVMQYYPLTYDTSSANYPFAESPANNWQDEHGNNIFAYYNNEGVIYEHRMGDQDDGTIRLALFNTNTTTPPGMYVITRFYANYSSNNSNGDTNARNYYFIVDNQKMLYYSNDEKPYQTELKVHFANEKDAKAPKAKDADAAVFYANDNKLSSNRTAWVTGYTSKYSWKHNSTTYTLEETFDIADSLENQFTFPSLTPRFSYIYEGQTIYLGEGNGTWAIGDPASRADSTLYELVVADNARSISCVLLNGNMTELKSDPNAPTSANYDYLVLNLDTGHGTKAEIVVGDNEIISNSRMEYEGDSSYVYVVDPTKVSQLKFRFEYDPNSMYADIDIKATVASWQANGFTKAAAFNEPEPSNNQYTFDIMQDFLKGVEIIDGASLSVSLLTYDDTRTNYTILFDVRDPRNNLTRLKDADNLARTMTELPGDYVYGLSDGFVFESDHTNNPYLDVKTITYREVDRTGEGTQPATQFKLYTGADGEKRIPFATLVGLHSNEMKYYYITEIDYAGHSTSYRVQIKGSEYANGITFIGAITDDGAGTQIGIEMHASSSSVSQFFLRNHSFKFESGDDYYTVFGSNASWHIGNDVGTGSASEEKLIKALNDWINIATERGVKFSYTLYDRIGEPKTFQCYNIRENAAKIQLDCFQTGLSSNIIMATVTNYDDLPSILFDENLTSLFTMKVDDRTVPDASTEGYFSLNGTQIQSNVNHELVITVTDPFGRTSITEYHQQAQSSIVFKVYGNTITDNGVLYVGDERGVSFSYLSTVYKALIYDGGTGEVLSDLQSFINDNMISYTFAPNRNSTTIQQYRIVATGRASGAVLFDQTFAFDTRLPVVEWKNSSDQTVEVGDQSVNDNVPTFVSPVIFDISNSPTYVNSLDVTVSYIRTLNGDVERVTLRPGTQKYTFDQEGTYEVTLRNTVWAKKTFKFEIVEINDTLVLVYDDDKLLEASPSDYKYNDTYIPRYVFTTAENRDSGITYPLANYQAHGLSIKVGQTSRVLAGNPISGTAYYDINESNRTLVWRLAVQTGENNGIPIYASPIYFATTGVTQGELNGNGNTMDGNAISLRLNGNPYGTDNNFIISPSTTTYHEIKNSFMELHDNQVEVSLACNADLLDESGAPFYLVKGNVILVDCYYNGQLIKTMQYGEKFIIKQYDAGFYEFAVHDLVGNYLYFGNSSDKNNILYKQERYMLAVLTKPLILINNQQPVNGMVYNDQVELKLVDYGNEFLSKRYASDIEKDENFFRSHFCITKIEVQYAGSNGTTTTVTNVNGSQTAFYWSNTGSYRVRVTYNLSESISDTLQAEYNFQIIPAYTIRESFSMPIYTDVRVVAVTHDGYKVTAVPVTKSNGDRRNVAIKDLEPGDNMVFNADINSGSYVVTLQTYNVILQDYITNTVQFNISHKANSARNYFALSSGSGTSTTGEVTLYYNPYWLYLAQGNITIHLYKDFVEQDVVTVNSSALTNSDYDLLELFSVSDAGLYTVKAYDAEGDLVYGDSWTVKAQQSTFGYIILAIVLGVAGVGLLVFLRMRRKMTTK